MTVTILYATPVRLRRQINYLGSQAKLELTLIFFEFSRSFLFITLCSTCNSSKQGLHAQSRINELKICSVRLMILKTVISIFLVSSLTWITENKHIYVILQGILVDSNKKFCCFSLSPSSFFSLPFPSHLFLFFLFLHPSLSPRPLVHHPSLPFYSKQFVGGKNIVMPNMTNFTIVLSLTKVTFYKAQAKKSLHTGNSDAILPPYEEVYLLRTVERQKTTIALISLKYKTIYRIWSNRCTGWVSQKI